MTEPPASSSPSANRSVRVWDLPTRIFHWLLVVLVAFSWWSGEQGYDWMPWHFWSGYAILTLLIYRILWGFFGSGTARFSDFIKGPKAGLHHLGALFRPGKTGDVGHNPLGGWMVALLLVLLLVQAGTGLFAEDANLNAGPLSLLVSENTSKALSDIHEIVVKFLLVAIGLHVLAVLVYLVFKRDNLVAAMFSGKKLLPIAPGSEPKMANPLLALALLVLSALIVFAIVRLG
jgi:cytochrome b